MVVEDWERIKWFPCSEFRMIISLFIISPSTNIFIVWEFNFIDRIHPRSIILQFRIETFKINKKIIEINCKIVDNLSFMFCFDNDIEFYCALFFAFLCVVYYYCNVRILLRCMVLSCNNYQISLSLFFTTFFPSKVCVQEETSN